MSYSLHPDAERDIAYALDFYSEQAGQRIAERFLSEFEHATRILADYPNCGAPIAQGRRIFPLRVFPYLIVFKIV